MKEIKIKLLTPNDILRGEFGKHMLRAYKEFLLAMTSIFHSCVERIEKLEKQIEEERKS